MTTEYQSLNVAPKVAKLQTTKAQQCLLIVLGVLITAVIGLAIALGLVLHDRYIAPTNVDQSFVSLRVKRWQ